VSDFELHRYRIKRGGRIAAPRLGNFESDLGVCTAIASNFQTTLIQVVFALANPSAVTTLG
jgi:hypothetical protein